MKRILLTVTFLIFITLSFTGAQTGEPKPEQQTQSTWELPANTAEKLTIRLLHESGALDRFVSCPSSIPAVGLPEMKEFVVDMTKIKDLLKSAGIKEKVTLEIYNLDKVGIADLGTYTPNILKDGQKEKISWPIPLYKKVIVSRELIREMRINRLKQDVSLAADENGLLVFRDAADEIKATMDILFYIPIKYKRDAYIQLDRDIVSGKTQAAATYCAGRKGRLRHECYHILAMGLHWKKIAKLIDSKEFDTAEDYCRGQGKELRPHCFFLAGENAFLQKDYQQAAGFYLQTNFPESFDRLGEIYYILGDNVKAANYYDQGSHSVKRAKTYGALADDYKKQGREKEAKEYYDRAVNEYEFMIKDYDYLWNDTDNNDRLRCRKERELLPKTPEEKEDERTLKKILDKAAAYCLRLEKEMIHFFCEEHIKEEMKFSKRQHWYNSFVYEYQLIQENNEVTERRILLKYNGIKTRKEDVPLGTSKYKYEKLIFGPIAFLKKFWQEYYDYKIVGEDTIDGQKAIVIEVIPLQNRKMNALVGKIWIKTPGFGVLKIQWHPKFSVENIREAVDQAQMQNAYLDIRFVSQFGIEKNGIRFPSKYYIEEYFVKEDGKRNLKAMIHADFKKHMFFSVGTAVVEEQGIE